MRFLDGHGSTFVPENAHPLNTPETVLQAVPILSHQGAVNTISDLISGNPRDLEGQVAEPGRAMRLIISGCASSTVLDLESSKIPSSFGPIMTFVQEPCNGYLLGVVTAKRLRRLFRYFGIELCFSPEWSRRVS